MISRSTGAVGPGVLEPDVGRRSSRPSDRQLGMIGGAGGATEDSVSSTSTMRSAQTDARGTMIAMNVAIMTAIRICMR